MGLHRAQNHRSVLLKKIKKGILTPQLIFINLKKKNLIVSHLKNHFPFLSTPIFTLIAQNCSPPYPVFIFLKKNLNYTIVPYSHSFLIPLQNSLLYNHFFFFFGIFHLQYLSALSEKISLPTPGSPIDLIIVIGKERQDSVGKNKIFWFKYSGRKEWDTHTSWSFAPFTNKLKFFNEGKQDNNWIPAKSYTDDCHVWSS